MTTADSIEKIYDTSFAFGGPLKQDKLWFWTAHRFWGYEQIRTNTFYEGNPNDFVFDPDRSRPGHRDAEERQHRPAPDLADQPEEQDLGLLQLRAAAHRALDARQHHPAGRVEPAEPAGQPLRDADVPLDADARGMLFEAAAGNMTEIWTREPVEDSTTSTGYPVTEQTTGINFRAYSATFSRNYTSLRSYRSALSYVTGSHAFKVGFTLQEGPAITDVYTSHDTALTVRNGVPFQVTVRTTPYTARERLVADLGVYLQDTWTINRLTANLGVRFDYLNNKVEEQSAAGGTWIGPRSFPAMTERAELQGHRAAPGRGLRPVRQRQDGAEGDAQPLHRAEHRRRRAAAESLQHLGQHRDAAVDRRNSDGIPQVCELGALSNNAFGQVNVATRYDPDTIEGFGKRRNNWEISASVTQELMSRLSVDATYYRRAQGNFTTTDNLDVAPADFDPYCVTAPRDPRLPDGGGQQICGLYDIVPTKFGVATNNIVDPRRASSASTQEEVFDGVDVAFSARLGGGVFLNGGVATGRTRFNQCEAFVDNPAETFGLTGATFSYCDLHLGPADAGQGQRFVHAAVAGDPDRRRAAEPARPADPRAVEHHAGRSRGSGSGPAAVRRRQHLARRAADQARHDVHAAPHADRSARLEVVPARRQQAAAADGGHLQPDQLERGGRRDVERRRTAGVVDHDLRLGVAAAAERAAGALHEVRHAADVLSAQRRSWCQAPLRLV